MTKSKDNKFKDKLVENLLPVEIEEDDIPWISSPQLAQDISIET